MIPHIAKVAMIDSVSDYEDAAEHALDLVMTCAIGGDPARYVQLLERGLTGAEAVELLYVEAFGPRPAGPPFPSLIEDPNPWKWLR